MYEYSSDTAVLWAKFLNDLISEKFEKPDLKPDFLRFEFNMSFGVISYLHYNDVTMGKIASQITCLVIVYSTVDSDIDQREHQSSASLAFVRGIHRGPVNSPYKWPVARNMFPFNDVIMLQQLHVSLLIWLVAYFLLGVQVSANLGEYDITWYIFICTLNKSFTVMESI